MSVIDLDVGSPGEVAPRLRKAAVEYLDGARDLDHFHQDPHAGDIWRALAKIMDRTATSVDATLKRMDW